MRPCCRGTRYGNDLLHGGRELELAPTTLAAVIGHPDAGFTVRRCARDGRGTATVAANMLQRQSAAGVGS